jgi:hypothetical protein
LRPIPRSVKVGDRIEYLYDFGDYDPARFDLTAANAAVAAI